LAGLKGERRAFVILLLSSALLFSSCTCTPEAGPVLLHPVPPEGTRYLLERGGLTLVHPGLKVTARPFDWRMAEELYGTDAGALAGIVFIALRIENSSGHNVVFSSAGASLVSQSGSSSRLLDISEIPFPHERPRVGAERGAHARALLSGDPVTVGPGEKIEGHLFFPLPPGKPRILSLNLGGIRAGDQIFDASFPFEVFLVDGRNPVY
jgi:hypothetical protein